MDKLRWITYCISGDLHNTILDARPHAPLHPIFFIFMRFSVKFGQIIGCTSLPPPPPTPAAVHRLKLQNLPCAMSCFALLHSYPRPKTKMFESLQSWVWNTVNKGHLIIIYLKISWKSWKISWKNHGILSGLNLEHSIDLFTMSLSEVITSGSSCKEKQLWPKFIRRGIFLANFQFKKTPMTSEMFYITNRQRCCRICKLVFLSINLFAKRTYFRLKQVQRSEPAREISEFTLSTSSGK